MTIPTKARQAAPDVAGWIRLARAIDHGIARLVQVHEAFRDELMIALVKPEARTAVTELAYGDELAVYAPGGRNFEGGLFAWERAGLDLMGLRPGATILVGGVGAGRELLGLSEAGFKVLAFEPNGELFAIAQRVSEGYPEARVLRGSYAHLVEAVTLGTGPLLATSSPFDAVILGWGSFPHLTQPSAQLAVLRSIRQSSPAAPVLFSFAMRPPGDDLGASQRARRVFRKAFDSVRRGPRGPGLRYTRRAGFVYFFSRDDVHDLAAQTGYRVARLEHSPYGHAVLVPTS